MRRARGLSTGFRGKRRGSGGGSATTEAADGGEAEGDGFEVGGFGEGGGVVRGVGGRPEFAGVGEGAADGVEEFVGGDVSGAGRAEEETATADVAGGGDGEFVIGGDGVGAVGFAACEGWGVDDGGVERVLGVGEPLEGVGLDGVALAVGDGGIVLIEGEIAVAGGEGVAADVDVGDRAGAAAGGLEGEAAGEAEGVEDVGSGGEAGEAAAVFALIEVEAGFLAFEDLGFEAEIVFEEDDDLGAIAVADAFGDVGGGEGGGGVAAETEDEGVGFEGVDDEGLDHVEVGQPDLGVEFEDESIVVAVEDEGWEAVAFAIDEADAGGGGGDEGGTGGDGGVEASLPPVGVDGGLLGGGEHADAHGGIGVVEACAEVAVGFARVDDGEFAGLAVAVLFADAFGEDPWVAGADGAFTGWGEPEFEPGSGRGKGRGGHEMGREGEEACGCNGGSEG